MHVFFHDWLMRGLRQTHDSWYVLPENKKKMWEEAYMTLLILVQRTSLCQ